MKTIYLAGLISSDYPESLEWRSEASYVLRVHFNVLDPLRGKGDLKEVSPDGGLNHPRLTAADIILRDYNDVAKSDLILVHLDDFGSPRPLIGTIVELGWAWLMKKPVVAIAKESNQLMRTHPFVVQCVAHYFQTLSQAVTFCIAEYR